ncbi:MAG: hypothetical protein C0631_16630 [Sedimenticola sp.]|nr:MAG: hypothetical protein C0631_16630 [Sedimenticola sp.]
MTQDDAFTDLRLNRQDGQNQESFWPSFTDIMTVIVMIFMIAMVILLLRNIELVNQLRATMEAERNALELAKTTGEEKETLAFRLIQAENELSMQRIRIMRLQEEKEQGIGTISEQTTTIQQLQNERDDLKMRRDQLVAENYAMNTTLKLTQTSLNTTKQNLSTLQQNLESTQQQLASTQEQLAHTQTDFTSLQTQFDATQQQLASLQERYELQNLDLQLARNEKRVSTRKLDQVTGQLEELKIKYERLVRPARSPEGRHVVEVRYGKEKGRIFIDLKTPDSPEFERVTSTTLDTKLSALRKEKAQGLYIKVIFPENSGLTFNEAWGFTNRLHQRYDYYYQEESAPDLIPEPIKID